MLSASDIFKALDTSQPKVVMLIGGTDTGKSTFARELLNLAVNKGLVGGYVDADVALGGVAPPALADRSAGTLVVALWAVVAAEVEPRSDEAAPPPVEEEQQASMQRAAARDQDRKPRPDAEATPAPEAAPAVEAVPAPEAAPAVKEEVVEPVVAADADAESVSTDTEEA